MILRAKILLKILIFENNLIVLIVTDLVNRLKVLAKKDNRSLNNYVENVLLAVAYDEPNETTKAAIKQTTQSTRFNNP